MNEVTKPASATDRAHAGAIALAFTLYKDGDPLCETAQGLLAASVQLAAAEIGKAGAADWLRCVADAIDGSAESEWASGFKLEQLQ